MVTAELLRRRLPAASAAHGVSGLYHGTQGAATVMGLEENIGTLAAGKLADIVALDLRVLDPRIHADAVKVDMPQLLTLGRANQAVTDVWVAGSRRVQIGSSLTESSQKPTGP